MQASPASITVLKLVQCQIPADEAPDKAAVANAGSVEVPVGDGATLAGSGEVPEEAEEVLLMDHLKADEAEEALPMGHLKADEVEVEAAVEAVGGSRQEHPNPPSTAPKMEASLLPTALSRASKMRLAPPRWISGALV